MHDESLAYSETLMCGEKMMLSNEAVTIAVLLSTLHYNVPQVQEIVIGQEVRQRDFSYCRRNLCNNVENKGLMSEQFKSSLVLFVDVYLKYPKLF